MSNFHGRMCFNIYVDYFWICFYNNVELSEGYFNVFSPSFIFQDVLSALKSCLSCDESFQYAEYVSVFATSESLLLLSKIIINEFNIYYGWVVIVTPCHSMWLWLFYTLRNLKFYIMFICGCSIFFDMIILFY